MAEAPGTGSTGGQQETRDGPHLRPSFLLSERPPVASGDGKDAGCQADTPPGSGQQVFPRVRLPSRQRSCGPTPTGRLQGVPATSCRPRPSPPIWLGERPGRLLPEGTQINRSVLLFQAVLRRLARPTAVAPVPSIAAAEGARFSNQEEERGGRDGTIRSPARG